MEQDDERPRPKRTKAERATLLAELHTSGKSVREFAAEHGVPVSSVYQWRKKKKKKKKKTAKSKKREDATKPGKSSFTEVGVVGHLAAGASHSLGLTVALRCGHTVSFEDQRLGLGWLESVFKVVGTC